MRDDHTPTDFAHETNGDIDPELSAGAASARVALLTRADEKRKTEVNTITEKLDEMLLGQTKLERRFKHMQRAIGLIDTKLLALAATSAGSVFLGAAAGSLVAGLLWHWLNE